MTYPIIYCKWKWKLQACALLMCECVCVFICERLRGAWKSGNQRKRMKRARWSKNGIEKDAKGENDKLKQIILSSRTEHNRINGNKESKYKRHAIQCDLLCFFLLLRVYCTSISIICFRRATPTNCKKNEHKLSGKAHVLAGCHCRVL